MKYEQNKPGTYFLVDIQHDFISQNRTSVILAKVIYNSDTDAQVFYRQYTIDNVIEEEQRSLFEYDKFCEFGDQGEYYENHMPVSEAEYNKWLVALNEMYQHMWMFTASINGVKIN